MTNANQTPAATRNESMRKTYWLKVVPGDREVMGNGCVVESIEPAAAFIGRDCLSVTFIDGDERFTAVRNGHDSVIVGRPV
jgi:hypothetical protein